MTKYQELLNQFGYGSQGLGINEHGEIQVIQILKSGAYIQTEKGGRIKTEIFRPNGENEKEVYYS